MAREIKPWHAHQWSATGPLGLFDGHELARLLKRHYETPQDIGLTKIDQKRLYQSFACFCGAWFYAKMNKEPTPAGQRTGLSLKESL